MAAVGTQAETWAGVLIWGMHKMQEHVRVNLCVWCRLFSESRESLKHDHFNSKRIRNAKIQEHVRCILGCQAKMQRTVFVATYAKLQEQCSLLRF